MVCFLCKCIYFIIIIDLDCINTDNTWKKIDIILIGNKPIVWESTETELSFESNSWDQSLDNGQKGMSIPLTFLMMNIEYVVVISKQNKNIIFQDSTNSFSCKLYWFIHKYWMTNFGVKIWDTSLVGSKLSPWLSQISSWACLWNALSLSPQTHQNIYNIWAQSLRFEPETRLKSFHETGPRVP